MLAFIRKRKAQSLAEYAIVISIVSAALVGMSFYLKRGIQGRIRDLTKNLTVGIGDVQYAGDQIASSSANNDIVRAPQVENIAGRTIQKTSSETLTRTAIDYSTPDQFGDLLPIAGTDTTTNIITN